MTPVLPAILKKNFFQLWPDSFVMESEKLLHPSIIKPCLHQTQPRPAAHRCSRSSKGHSSMTISHAKDVSRWSPKRSVGILWTWEKICALLSVASPFELLF
jgi:hypothetical protein